MYCGQKMIYMEISNIEQNRYLCNQNFLYTRAIQEIQYKIMYSTNYDTSTMTDTTTGTQYRQRSVQKIDDNDSTTVA